MSVLELYAGIGGVAASGADVVAAIDQDPWAHTTYVANFSHPAHRLNLASVRADRLRAFGADLWWLSPPCQPFTVRGAKRDVYDRRCESLLNLLDVLTVVQPETVIVENVPGFEGSIAHARLRQALPDHERLEVEWSPCQLGLPVERRRFYLVATRTGRLPELPSPTPRPLAGFLEDQGPPLDPEVLARFGHALHVVDADDPDARACCFTKAYGHSPVYAGSYLRQHGSIRLFTPREIARLHGFPDTFVLPGDDTRARRLLGNTLSVDVVRVLLTPFDVAEPARIA